jgi:hypothetical protein
MAYPIDHNMKKWEHFQARTNYGKLKKNRKNKFKRKETPTEEVC